MQEPTTSASDTRIAGTRLVQLGIAAVVVILALAGYFLLATLPDANEFNERVRQIFVENEVITGRQEIRLLEILAQSGTSFAEVLASYRTIIFVMLVFATGLLIACLVFLVAIVTLNKRLMQIERSGIQVASLVISREENSVYLNDMQFKLTSAAMETLSVLAEARMDDEMLTGAELESMVSGRSAADCDEAAGATRIKRLRDTLGNQMVSELLVKNVARRGYTLAIDKTVIRMM